MGKSLFGKIIGGLFGNKNEAPVATPDSLYLVDGKADAKVEPKAEHHNTTGPQDESWKNISLAKTLEQQAPRLVNLAKAIDVNLKKEKLETLTAKVAFVLDASGSMTDQFRGGNVQAVLDRIAALAVQFDDDGNLDLWGFGSKFAKYPDVTLQNLDGYIKTIQNNCRGENLPGLGGSNNEPPVMNDLINYFKDSEEPVIVYFITDGGIDKSAEIKKAIAKSAHYPIYWKFIGLGGSNYGVLEDLDDFEDRVIDNTDFFAIDDFKKVSDDVLYSKLLTCIRDWLNEASGKSLFHCK